MTLPRVCCALLLTLATAGVGAETLGPSNAVVCREHARSGGSPASIDTCTQAIRSDGLLLGDLAATFSHRGLIHAQLGDLDRALADQTRALELQPQLVPALINRANVLTRMGRLEDALADYAMAEVYSEGRNAQVFYNRSFVHARRGDIEAARHDVLRAVQLRPQSHRYREALALLE